MRIAAAAAGRGVEDAVREIVELHRGVFEDFGRTVGDGFQQAQQQADAGGAALRAALQRRLEEGKGARIVVAHRHDAVCREHEGDVGQRRAVAVGTAEDGGGHEDGAVFRVKAARGLDVLQVLARRHGNAEQAFDQRILGLGGAVHIDPDDGGIERFGACFLPRSGAGGVKFAHLARRCMKRDHREAARLIAALPSARPQPVMPAHPSARNSSSTRSSRGAEVHRERA